MLNSRHALPSKPQHPPAQEAMLKSELIERAARFRSAEGGSLPQSADCPALVLNADYTPLSYYPLSLWPWQTAIKAVFLERVDIVASYDREVHSPSWTMQIPR
jgi:hypothetical protein